MNGQGAQNVELLETRARDLVPVFAARSAEAEKLRCVPKQTIADCVEAGLTRVVQPARFGGFALDWDVLCTLAMTLGQGCTSQAWVATVLAEHAYLAGLFPLEAQEEIWRDNPHALVSTSFVPAGRVSRKGDGFVLNGRWPFSSGVHHADWTIVGELVRDPDRQPAHCFFLVPRSERVIIDDWSTMGMVATGSCSVQLDDVFVPVHRVVESRLIAEGAAPGAMLDDAPIFRMPLLGYAHTVLASVIVGSAQGMLDVFVGSIADRVRAAPSILGGDLTFARIAESSAEIESARLMILDATRSTMRTIRQGGKLTNSDAQATGRNGAYAAVLATHAARRVFEIAGARSIYETSPLQRFFRDITAAASHAALSWDKISVGYGRSALGLDASRNY